MAEAMFNAYQGDEPYFFVCYSHDDSDLVYGEMRWFHGAGVNLWYDEGIEAGATWRRAVAEALENAAGVVFMCSAQSLGSSHCTKEISYALDHNKPIYVVRLDRAVLTPELALYLNDTQILERSSKQPEVYRQKLLGALNRHAPLNEPPPREPVIRKGSRVFPLVLAVSALAAIGLAAWFGRDLMQTSPAQSSLSTPAEMIEFPRVAILPMEVLTPDDALDFLARVSEDDLRGRMQASIYEPVNVPGSLVDASAVEIGRELDVGYVWYRTAARRGDAVRISKRLTETRTGRDIRVIQRDLLGSDPFDLQDQLAAFTEDIMGALDAGETERADEVQLDEMGAVELMYTSKGDRRSNVRKALDMAPDYFGPNAAMAEILFEDYINQQTDRPEEVAAEALRLARRARQLAPFDQWTNKIAVELEFSVGSVERAYSYARQFLELKSVSTWEFYDALIVSGRADEALAHAEANPIAHVFSLGHLYLALGRYEEACQWYRTWTVENPDIWQSWWSLANCLSYLDRPDEVAQIMQGLKDNGWTASVADVETGFRRYWGRSDFADIALNGLRRLGY